MPNSRPGLKRSSLAIAAGFLLFTSGLSRAEEVHRLPAPKGLAASTAKAGDEDRPSDVELYCKNIAQSAEEARITWQTWNLLSLETKVKAQVALLEKKRAEFEDWVERREKLLEEVEGHVVSIVSRMRPETAAAQLATADEDTATGVLMKLKARVASEILDEMDPARAAQLTQAMVGFTDPKKRGEY